MKSNYKIVILTFQCIVLDNLINKLHFWFW